MKKAHIFLYHSFFWIYRVIYLWTYVYFMFGEAWYKGAYIVQLVLMPFFYINYGGLMPLLLSKKYKYFSIASILWVISFVWVYSNWTIYQAHFLYGENIKPADYIETLNNLIYVWLISSGACLFEFWIKNRKKNQLIALDRNRHLLRSGQNRMLNHLLSDYLNTLDNISQEELPDKILLVSDFFKYLLYSRDRLVSLKTEINYLKQYEELKNANISCVKIHYKNLHENTMIRSTQLISIINRFVEILYVNEILEITVEHGNQNELIVSTASSNENFRKELMTNEYRDSIKEYVFEDEKTVVVSVDQYSKLETTQMQ